LQASSEALKIRARMFQPYRLSYDDGMQNPFWLIVEAADFVMRSVLSIYLSFALSIVVLGLISRLVGRLLAHAMSLNWSTTFVNIFTIAGAVAAALLSPHLLYHSPVWLR